MELCAHGLLDEITTAAPSAVKSLRELARQLRQAVTQTRLLSHGLSPVSLEADGLMNALRELAESTRTLANNDCKFVCDTAVLVRDTTRPRTFIASQEAVNNALKHSRAKEIRISLANSRDWLTLSVSDNGRGGARAQANGTGMGLRVMKYRADLIGVSLEVDSAPRRGTRVTCTVAKSL